MYSQQSTQQAATELITAAPELLREFRCPICGEVFGTYEQLQDHYAASHEGAVTPVTVSLLINGKRTQVLIEPHWTLQRTLQFRLGLTGAKHMCDKGVCGSCTVIVDGRAVLACMTLTVEVEGKDIETVEGIAANPAWKPLIDAYCRWDAMQCGYCTPGFLVSAKSLLDHNPNPTEQECKEALAGNICICGTYPRHSQAILEAVYNIANPPPPPAPPMGFGGPGGPGGFGGPGGPPPQVP
ncbi:MAG: 2Fe-2S iron-sulfur cluster binding domain-containing protein [Oscillospiraceae bacterium]|jgi:xanthine dehydrogenase YagT iron-sulfur-binding subunit|nr:2Fe-2S iron-sulfur cluster binding domain-containing protein [Oscillospiraceae bacterium]